MRFIDDNRHDVVGGRPLGVEPICEVLSSTGLQVAPSTYYAAKKREPSARAVRDEELRPRSPHSWLHLTSRPGPGAATTHSSS